MEYQINENIVLRSFLYGDAQGLAENGNNKNIFLYQRNSYPFPYTIEYARHWIQYIKENHRDTRFVIASNEGAIGEIGFVIHTDVHSYTGEVAFWIGEKYWGQGITTQALKRIIKYAFEEKKLKRLYADVIEYNNASMKVLQKCGFQLDGVLRKNMYKNGKFYDQMVFSILADDDSIIQ